MLHSANASATQSRKKCHSSHCWCALDCFSLSRGEWTVQMLQLACNMVGDRRVSWNDVTTLPSIAVSSCKGHQRWICGMWKFSNVYRFRRQMTKASKRPTHREFVKDRLLDCIFLRFLFSSKNLVQVPIECHVSRNPRHLCHASHCRSLSVSVQPIYQDLGSVFAARNAAKTSHSSNPTHPVMQVRRIQTIVSIWVWGNRIIQGEGVRTCVHTHL